jgi:DNA-binding NarL/FixJ family response regulator
VTIRVLIADDQAIILAGLRVIVNRDPELVVVGEAADGAEAVKLTRQLHPDVVLMDVRMPGLDGIRATRELLGSGGDPSLVTRIIILTTFDTDEHVFEALRAGASGFLLKDTGPNEIRHAIHVVAAGDSLLAPSVTRRLIAAYTSQPEVLPFLGERIESLTERETEVVALVARGLSNEEIAGTLFVTVATAKTHVSRAMTKLRARDRAQMVIAAYESGLARAGRPAGPQGRPSQP